ncbi:MAG: hypothetical protein A2168_02345 [Planctomycetes bacterium RBG_13_50_24]|nr:MAG: hypothetical protein A2168_02345 [Planctomycetes bacterium RBG_13_50_24]
MANIHIGKISRTESGKGKVELFYHIPIDMPVGGIVPTPESTIAAQLQQAEIDTLAAGSLVEVSRNIVVLDGQTQAEIADAIRADWQNAKTDYNNKYNFTYKFYGATLDATA